MQEYIQVMTTVEQRSDAERIARTLVEKRLAACVQVAGPVTSYFHWEGKLMVPGNYLSNRRIEKEATARHEERS